MQKRVKLFKNGRSQAVRLPVEFRFKGDAVYIRKDPKTGDVILSQRPTTWEELFARIDAHGGFPADFMDDRQQLPIQERDLF